MFVPGYKLRGAESSLQRDFERERDRYREREREMERREMKVKGGGCVVCVVLREGPSGLMLI